MTRVCALVFVGIVFAAGLLAPWISAHRYDEMFREDPELSPTREHPLGTDSFCRDRFARLTYGTRISLVLAPVAALAATLLAALVGGGAGLLGGWPDRALLYLSDLFLALPWLFLLIAVRALLPLNSKPELAVTVTFLLLGLLGWAGPARIVRAKARTLARRDDLLLARACGLSKWRALRVHVVPNLRPLLKAQFWIAVPIFILSEANLSLIGLGIADPLPSWGTLLRELESFSSVAGRPWMLAPLALLVLVVVSFQLVLRPAERELI